MAVELVPLVEFSNTKFCQQRERRRADQIGVVVVLF